MFRADVFDDLQHEVEIAYRDRGIAPEERKDVIGNLLRVVLSDLLLTDPAQWGPYLDVARTALGNQDIVMYHTDASVQRILEEQGWAGEMRVSATHDHFMVVDANMAALKTDARLDRSYNYTITPLLNGRYQATLRIDTSTTAGLIFARRAIARIRACTYPMGVNSCAWKGRSR